MRKGRRRRGKERASRESSALLVCDQKILIDYSDTLVGGEALDGLGSGRDDLEHVEPHSLRKWPALPDNDGVSLLATEARGQVHGDVLVPLLVTLVLLDEVEVVPTNDNGAVHLGRLDDPLQNPAPDGNVSGERALLVDVGSLDGLPWGLEAKADVLVVAVAILSRGPLLEDTLELGRADVALLKVRSLALHLGRGEGGKRRKK
eukprot:CAMPEP_0197505382 /NCGR_PEP_ID=MMETSP1312-20131121/4149_1 /TAXON_ID=464262 /ORGANISM="Genus nov. species nov., Strain RCC2335" /LENGTH=203 /DNA_ID=CAMNT_0043052325 /DNA_START=105 /DNA_END=714 /DNA_ORIENTATION=+